MFSGIVQQSGNSRLAIATAPARRERVRVPARAHLIDILARDVERRLSARS